MFDPVGTVRLVSDKDFNGASRAGGELAHKLVDKQGSAKWVRLSDLGAAIDGGDRPVDETKMGQIRQVLAETSQVNASWVNAARRCWLGLAAESDGSIRLSLSQPVQFRKSFIRYSTLSDRDIRFLEHEQVQITSLSKRGMAKEMDSTAGLVNQSPANTKTLCLLQNGDAANNSENDWFRDVSPDKPRFG